MFVLRGERRGREKFATPPPVHHANQIWGAGWIFFAGWLVPSAGIFCSALQCSSYFNRGHGSPGCFTLKDLSFCFTISFPKSKECFYYTTFPLKLYQLTVLFLRLFTVHSSLTSLPSMAVRFLDRPGPPPKKVTGSPEKGQGGGKITVNHTIQIASEDKYS